MKDGPCPPMERETDWLGPHVVGRAVAVVTAAAAVGVFF